MNALSFSTAELPR